VRLSAIEPRNVAGLSVREMAFMMNVSMELEEPILEYSHQNGEGFRLLLPALARFMGKDREEAARAALHHLPWCESPWCAEERRHAGAFARMIERLTRATPGRENPNRPMIATPDEEAAARLVVSREAAEWNSSSTYIVMAAHATGDLHHLIRNVARDEIKHLAILSAAALYLFGPRPWQRFARLVRQSLDQYRRQKGDRSGGELLGTNPVTAFEVIVSHLLSERRLRKWLKTIPLSTLCSSFEMRPNQPPPVASALPPERQAQLDETLREGKQKRASLARWRPQARGEALEQQGFEESHSAMIGQTVATRLDGFRGAEMPGSRGDRRLRRRIGSLGPKLFRTCLLNRLRDYQVRNNRHVMAFGCPAEAG
jgi:hypothetical protein